MVIFVVWATHPSLLASSVNGLLAGSAPKTVTSSRQADGWYVSFACADVLAAPLPQTGRQTGIDMGLRVFLVAADGEPVPNRRSSREGEQQLATAQRRVSRRTKGSTRWWNAVGHCAKQQQVKRQRRDVHHKTALALLRQYDVIYLKDLQVRNLVRNHHLAKSISGAR
jgi:putative transposase